MGEPGGVIFLTEKGDEYIITEAGTDWRVEDIVKIFPDIYQAYNNLEDGAKDERGFVTVGN